MSRLALKALGLLLVGMLLGHLYCIAVDVVVEERARRQHNLRRGL